MRGARQPHESTPAILAVSCVPLCVYNHTDPVVLVLCPSHVPCERSAVAFLLTDPDLEMP